MENVDKTYGVSKSALIETLDNATHTDRAAQRKIGIAGWEPCIFERLDGGMLITGGIPTVSKGGKKKWPAKKIMQRIILTKADVTAEKMLYAQTTGKCPDCYGTGQQLIGWSRDSGNKYRVCEICGGTGKSGV